MINLYFYIILSWKKIGQSSNKSNFKKWIFIAMIVFNYEIHVHSPFLFLLNYIVNLKKHIVIVVVS